MGIPECPHCGKKVNFIRAWALKREGEYWCKECGGISDVRLEPLAYILGFGSLVISLIAFLVYLFAFKNISFWLMFFMIAPYLLFNLLSCFFVHLRGGEHTEAQEQPTAVVHKRVEKEPPVREYPSVRHHAQPSNEWHAQPPVRPTPPAAPAKQATPPPPAAQKQVTPPYRQVPPGTYGGKKPVETKPPFPTQQNTRNRHM